MGNAYGFLGVCEDSGVDGGSGYEAAGNIRLLDMLRERIRVRHYSIRTEKSYEGWVRRFVVFSGMRHPRELGKGEVEKFLTYLAVERGVAASTQNLALNSIAFLYFLTPK